MGREVGEGDVCLVFLLRESSWVALGVLGRQKLLFMTLRGERKVVSLSIAIFFFF